MSSKARYNFDHTNARPSLVLPLISTLSRATRLTDVLPELHRSALEATGGSCALLFERNPRTGMLEATSGYGVEELSAEPWLPSPDEAALVDDAFGRSEATLIGDVERQMPDLASRLGTKSALLIPMVQAAERSGLVIIGLLDGRVPTEGTSWNGIADAYLAALALVRLRQSEERRRDLDDVLAEFSLQLSTSLDSSASLQGLCAAATRVFGADRTTVWLHDRDNHRLMLEAASDPGTVSYNVGVDTTDQDAPAALGMRRTGAELFTDGGARGHGPTLTIPLRGQRRALGTIVADGVRLDTGEELDLLERADRLGRHVSHAIESFGLLQALIQARRTLEAPPEP